jgi:hypothetical protein
MRVDAELYDLCKDFIRDNKITCEETIYQSHRIEANALELIEQICELLGFHEEEEEEEYEEN